MDLATLRAFEREVRKLVPPFRVAFKNESLWIRLLAFLLPFHPELLTRYTTTYYPTVYFPSRAQYEAQPKASFIALAHALVHLIDTRDRPFRSRLAFAFPQCLSVVLMMAYCLLVRRSAWILGIAVGGYLLGCLFAKQILALFYILSVGGLVLSSALAVQHTHWAAALLLSAFAMLAPWPSSGRHRLVMREYSMNLAITQWTYGGVPDFFRQGILKVFSGIPYYFVSWGRRVNTSEEIDRIVSDAQRGVLQRQFPYDMVYGFLRKNNLLKV